MAVGKHCRFRCGYPSLRKPLSEANCDLSHTLPVVDQQQGFPAVLFAFRLVNAVFSSSTGCNPTDVWSRAMVHRQLKRFEALQRRPQVRFLGATKTEDGLIRVTNHQALQTSIAEVIDDLQVVRI